MPLPRQRRRRLLRTVIVSNGTNQTQASGKITAVYFVQRLTALVLAAAMVMAAQAPSSHQADTAALLSLGAIKIDAAIAADAEVPRAVALKEAERLFERVASLDSKNIASFYWLGVIGWMKWFPAFSIARVGYQAHSWAPLPEQTRLLMKSNYSAILSASIEHFKRVVELDPRNYNAMLYLYMSIGAMASLEESPVISRRVEDDAYSWGARVLETAAANQADGSVSYPPISPKLRQPVLPFFPYTRSDGSPGFFAEESVSENQVVLYSVRGPRSRKPSMRVDDLEARVHMQGICTKGGILNNLTTISGHPMLVAIAVSAANDWVQTSSQFCAQPMAPVFDLWFDFDQHCKNLSANRCPAFGCDSSSCLLL